LYGLPKIKEIAYDAYASNIDMFVAATTLGRKLIVKAEGAKILFSQHALPIHHPPVVFIPAAKLNADQMEAFLKAIEKLRPRVVMSGKTATIVLDGMIPTAIPYIQSVAQDNTHKQDGAIPFRTYVALMHLESCVIGFLCTNTYPAFSVLGDMEVDAVANGTGDRQALDGGIYAHLPREVVIENRKQAAIARGDDPEEVSDVVDYDEDTDACESELTMDGSVLVAKPSTAMFTYNTGDVGQVPAGIPGLCFPWFPRMNLPDKNSIRSKTSSLFKRTFGNTHEENKAGFATWRGDIEPICDTNLGMALSHMLTGFKLSLETQTRCFVIIQRREYVGFVLLGSHFSIWNDSRWVMPVSPEDLRAELSRMSTHDAALESIARDISRMELETYLPGEQLKTVTSADINTAIKLFGQLSIRGRKAVPVGMADKFGQLSYGRPYRTIGISDMKAALKEMASDDPFPADYPMYIPPSLPDEFFGDRVYQVLASFGPESFSFINTQGTTYSLQSPDVQEDLQTITQGGTMTKPGILVARKGVMVAYQDMKKVIAEKMYRMDLRERAAKHRNLFYEKDQRDELVGLLRELVWKDRIPEEATKKRKANPSDKGEGPGKRAKTAAEMLSFAINF
jgi:hypothetical protein